jgi:CDP-diacylglycerol--serine O-phosphatidyltransferase
MPETKWQQTFQAYLPNSITFLSLGSGLISIILSSQGLVLQAAFCILLSVFLDSLDGYLARKLNTASSFGMQLDSLSDIVSFGVAPILLVWRHLNLDALLSIWILPIFVLQIIAGAFRLARFNLQTPKQHSHDETLGLTITQSGLALTLAVLSDLSIDTYALPVWTFALLSLLISYLMVSRLVFPSPGWYAPTRRFYLFYLLLGVVLAYVSSIFTMLLVIYLGGLAVSISRQFFLISFRS